MADNLTQEARVEQALMRPGTRRGGARWQPDGAEPACAASRHVWMRSTHESQEHQRTRAWGTDMANPRTTFIVAQIGMP